eukprot:Rhum_TRINITY_DN15299_c3_g1::Rhum_TRINITY_DN15299_c3_g1_i6::g.149557::m.149557
MAAPDGRAAAVLVCLVASVTADMTWVGTPYSFYGERDNNKWYHFPPRPGPPPNPVGVMVVHTVHLKASTSGKCVSTFSATAGCDVFWTVDGSGISIVQDCTGLTVNDFFELADGQTHTMHPNVILNQGNIAAGRFTISVFLAGMTPRDECNVTLTPSFIYTITSSAATFAPTPAPPPPPATAQWAGKPLTEFGETPSWEMVPLKADPPSFATFYSVTILALSPDADCVAQKRPLWYSIGCPATPGTGCSGDTVSGVVPIDKKNFVHHVQINIHVTYGKLLLVAGTNQDCDDDYDNLVQVKVNYTSIPEPPLTPAPPTFAPPTPAPPTPAPPTQAPPTHSPPTPAPPTNAPPTHSPPTPAPPTDIPPTHSPPTAAPPTNVPPTQMPVTVAPPTLAPLTLAPPAPGHLCPKYEAESPSTVHMVACGAAKCRTSTYFPLNTAAQACDPCVGGMLPFNMDVQKGTTADYTITFALAAGKTVTLDVACGTCTAMQGVSIEIPCGHAGGGHSGGLASWAIIVIVIGAVAGVVLLGVGGALLSDRLGDTKDNADRLQALEAYIAKHGDYKKLPERGEGFNLQTAPLVT